MKGCRNKDYNSFSKAICPKLNNWFYKRKIIFTFGFTSNWTVLSHFLVRLYRICSKTQCQLWRNLSFHDQSSWSNDLLKIKIYKFFKMNNWHVLGHYLQLHKEQKLGALELPSFLSVVQNLHWARTIRVIFRERISWRSFSS